MKFAVLDRAFSPSLETPMTYDRWEQMHHTLDACLEARDVHWLFSLISTQGDRSVCLFQVPYTDTVREACRESRMSFQCVWQADLWTEQNLNTFAQGSSLIVVDSAFDPPITKKFYESNKQHAKGCLQELNIQPILSAVTLDGTRSICMFAATSAEDVRSLYRKVRMPFKAVWKATLLHSIA